MNKIFPLSLFPDQFFPDVELQSVQLLKEEFKITVSEGEWGIQSDIILFYGPGVMTFAYSGTVSIRWRERNKTEWYYTQQLETLEHVIALEMIAHDKSGWRFQFRSSTDNYVIEVVLQELKSINWSGDGENMDDYED